MDRDIWNVKDEITDKTARENGFRRDLNSIKLGESVKWMNRRKKQRKKSCTDCTRRVKITDKRKRQNKRGT